MKHTGRTCGDEVNRCLMCKSPFCTGCPAGTAVHQVIELVKMGKITEAGELLFNNNPMTAITGSVCPNHLFCQASCILSKKGDGINFSLIEKEVSTRYLLELSEVNLARPKPCSLKKPPAKILIVGGGPCGLTLGYFLGLAGFHVEIHEQKPKTGGMVRYGIPDFRLDKSLITKIEEVIRSKGVKVYTNSHWPLGNIAMNLKRSGGMYDEIILAVGAWIPNFLGIVGEELKNVYHGINFLEKMQTARASDSYIIVGGGNVAVDCALVAATKQREAGLPVEVIVCYRKGQEFLKCYPDMMDEAVKLGIAFKFHHVPREVSENGAWFEVDGMDRFIPASEVVIAVGQSAVHDNGENGLIMAQNFNIGYNGIWAAGDATTGTKTIIEAVADAKKLAKILIDKYGKSRDEGKYQSISEQVFKEACAHLKINPDEINVNLHFVDEVEIKELNIKHLGRDKVTDVLSFPLLELKPGEIPSVTIPRFKLDINPETNKLELGDIVICLDVATKQAGEIGNTAVQEVAFLYLHGLLHLLGYDHERCREQEKRMFDLQDAILEKAGLKDK